MNWEQFYFICFAIGLVLSLAAFLGGFGHLHIGHFHLGHHAGVRHLGAGSGSGHGPHSASAVSPFNGFSLVSFLCWFGGTGFLLCHLGGLLASVVLLLSLLSGAIGAAIVFFFLARVLLPRERELTAEDSDMIGMVGRVTGAIGPGATGEIIFTQGGSRRASPARSDQPVRIAKGAEVVVMRYERGVAYVQPWDELSRTDLGGDVQPRSAPRYGGPLQ